MLPDVGMACIPVFEDNDGAVQLVKNPITNSNLKQMNVRHHFRRELEGRKEISTIHVRIVFFSARKLLYEGNTTGIVWVLP